MQCPQCHSDNIQKLSIVYEHGTQHIRTSGRTYGSGAGFGGGGLGAGFGSARTTTSGKSQSIAARNAAPPEKKKMMIPVGMIAVGLFAMLAFHAPVIGLLLAAGGGFVLWKFSQYNSKTYPPLYAQWQRSWLCSKCGAVFAL